jgi:HEAT repeat protein
VNKTLVNKCRRLLLDSTRHPEPFVRAEGARLLGELREPAAVPYLTGMLLKDHWYSKITAVYALAAIKDRRCIPVLRSIARGPLVFDFSGMYNHDMIRIAAAMALLMWNDSSGIDNIHDLLRSKTSEAYIHIGPSILALPDSPAAKKLKEQISFEYLQKSSQGFQSSFQSGMQLRIVQALAYFRNDKALPLIKKYLQHFSPYVRAGAAQSLLRYRNSPEHLRLLARLLGREKAAFTRTILAQLLIQHSHRSDLLPVIIRSLHHTDYFIRATAVDALSVVGQCETAVRIVPMLDDEHFYVRVCAIDALEKMRYATVSDRIEKMLHDENPRVRLQAAKYCVTLAVD